MLERIRLIDFKSFVDEEVELAPLTLLVGANASGKSNFLDAIRFLQQTTTDSVFTTVLDGEERAGAERWPGLRGGAAEAARVGRSVFSIESTWSAPIPGELDFDSEDAWPASAHLVELTHSISCRTAPNVLLERESLGKGRAEGSLFATGAIKGDRIELPWRAIGRRSIEASEATALVGRELSVLWEILGSINPGSPIVPKDVVDYASALTNALARIQLYNIQPAQMRGYGRRNAELGEEGKNISGVLAGLCEDAEEKRTLVEWLSELCAPELADLDFIDVKELGDVMLMLVEKGGRRISARSLSDGTLRFLGLLVALRTARRGSVILMEEIGADLHPTRVRLLIEYLQAVAQERDVQVIATTHSPVVLEWLGEKAQEDVIVFGRIPEREGTLLRRLGDLPNFREAVKRSGIEELFTTGWLEMAL